MQEVSCDTTAQNERTPTGLEAQRLERPRGFCALVRRGPTPELASSPALVAAGIAPQDPDTAQGLLCMVLF